MLELLLRTPLTERLVARLFEPAVPLHAPHLLDVEVTQVLRRYESRGELTAARGTAALHVLTAFPVRRHAHVPLVGRAWEMRHNLTAYDAVYVALAEVLGATLLTRDARLAAAPGARGRVELVYEARERRPHAGR